MMNNVSREVIKAMSSALFKPESLNNLFFLIIFISIVYKLRLIGNLIVLGAWLSEVLALKSLTSS